MTTKTQENTSVHPETKAPKTRTVRVSNSLMAVSPEIGENLFYEIITHDDGIHAMGGVSAALVSIPGGGKSTLLMQLAQLVCHVPGRAAKWDVANLKNQHRPETVIWRGLEYDHWAGLIPEFWMRSFPDYPSPKPLRLHIYCRDHITFYLDEISGGYQLILPAEDVKHYNSVEELYENLLPGGINVVYEPQEYYLSQQALQRILAAQLTKAAAKYSEMDEIRAPSHLWWYEFIEILTRVTQRREHFTLIIDEATGLFPFGAGGVLWHMIAWLVETFIHLRKRNISIIFALHGLDLVDTRIAKRIMYYIWLPGSLPSTSNSRVTPTLIGTLPLGWGIVEQPRRRFGRFRFGRIPNQPPVVQAKGLSGI